MLSRVCLTAVPAAAAALALFLLPAVQGQSPTDSSSQSSSQSTIQQTSEQTSATPYIVVNPLSNVKYDNRYDLSLGMAYDHMKAGPTLLQGSNLGGLDLSGSYWLTRRLGIEGSGRGYLGTSGAGVNPYNIKGPFVSEYFFVGGPEWLGPHNKHGDLIAHALFGGVHGNFEQDLRGNPPSSVAFYNNQNAFAMIIGGHIDLNRSEHWVLRITPDSVWTHYGINYAPYTKQWDVNFAISVGVEYKFSKKR
jgi:hypothetical protein